MTDTFDANVKIKDLPRKTDTILNGLCDVRGCLKWEIVREALIEYAEGHKNEIVEALKS